MLKNSFRGVLFEGWAASHAKQDLASAPGLR
jgi:hypothetical protein